MKSKLIFGTMLGLLLIGSISLADDDADKKRLLEEYEKVQAEKAKEQPQVQVTEATETVGENDMTESERMDVEVQRIKKRMLEINDKIDNYNKTNEMIDNLEKNVGELERKIGY